MRIEPKQAFYNDATGAVQPWKDIEVTDAVGNSLVAEGLVTEIEGGGGGDFTTVKATVKNNSAVNFKVSIPNLFNDGGEFILTPTAAVMAGAERVLDVILYKNAGAGYIDVLTFGNTITVSGDAEYDDGYIYFAGDFTITYSEG